MDDVMTRRLLIAAAARVLIVHRFSLVLKFNRAATKTTAPLMIHPDYSNPFFYNSRMHKKQAKRQANPAEPYRIRNQRCEVKEMDCWKSIGIEIGSGIATPTG
jgi:hypothetical protein